MLANPLPGDLSTFLWHFYGGMLSEDLAGFRSATRQLLDDFTAHWQRQRVGDASMAEDAVGNYESLSHIVALDRMDRIEEEFGHAKMALL